MMMIQLQYIFLYRLFGEDRKNSEHLKLSEHFNKPHVVEGQGKLDGLIRGIATQSSQKVDWHLSSHVS